MKIRSQSNQENLGTLRSVPLFRKWPEDALVNAAMESRCIDFAAGEVIVQEGQLLDGLYVIAAGEMTIGASHEDGRRYVRRYAGTGQVYGLVSMFDGKANPQFFMARVDARILIVPKRIVLETLDRHPHLLCEVVEQWTKTHRTLLAGLREVTFMSLRIRLTRALIAHASQFGTRYLSDAPIDLPLTQEEIANLVGVTRQSIGRELKRLEREGQIEILYGGVRICSPHAMQALEDEDS